MLAQLVDLFPDWVWSMICVAFLIAVAIIVVLVLVRHYKKYIKIKEPDSAFPVILKSDEPKSGMDGE